MDTCHMEPSTSVSNTMTSAHMELALEPSRYSNINETCQSGARQA